MNKKKVVLTVLAMVLVCAMSVMGTAAFLFDKTETPVKNTFVASGGGELIGDGGALTLQEHTVTADTNGNYTLTTTTTNTGVEYKIVPSMEVPKDPSVSITEKTGAPAYLYIEYINTLKFSTVVEGTETLNIDDANWEPLMKDGAQVTGPNGGKVYIYVDSANVPIIVTDDLTEVNIIKDKKFTVNKDATKGQLAEANQELTFYAYLAQATMGDTNDAADIYNAVFNTTSSEPTP